MEQGGQQPTTPRSSCEEILQKESEDLYKVDIVAELGRDHLGADLTASLGLWSDNESFGIADAALNSIPSDANNGMGPAPQPKCRLLESQPLT